MNYRTEVINDLTCHILDELPAGQSPRNIVVLCHGYGASGTDLVPLGQMLLRHPKMASTVQLLFPEAPLSLEELGMPDGRAWWPLDMYRLQKAVALGTFRDLRNDCPPQLPAAREKLRGLVEQWSLRSSIPLDRFVLGGFSQGAMLATDVTLQFDSNTAGLVVLSGTLLNEKVWQDRAGHHAALRVFQSHGTDDQILPFDAAGSLRDMLNQSGVVVDFMPFNGGHEIPFPVLNRFGTFLQEVFDDGVDDGTNA